MNEIIILSMAKGWGGAEEYLDVLTGRFTRRGIPHRIMVREGGEYAGRNVKKAGMVPISHGLKGFFQLRKTDPISGKPRIIHVNRYYDLIRGWYLKRLHPHSLLILYQHCYLNHPHRITLSLTDGIICISEFVKSSITLKFPVLGRRILVLNPGIDLELFAETKKDYRFDGPIKIGMAGRFDKNQEDLVWIAGELARLGIPVVIHFGGSGKPEEAERLRKIIEQCGISNNVIFRGYIPHQYMPYFYLDMDIAASTMRREGLSLVAMEAMACGLPFVAYRAPGFDELISHERDGILVDGGVPEFVSALKSLIAFIEIRKRIGENAARKARESFGIETHVNRYLAFIQELLKKKGDCHMPFQIGSLR